MRVDQERRVGEQHGFAVGRGAGDRLGTDHGAGARAVLDHRGDVLGAADLLGQHAGDDVGAAACRQRNHDLQGSSRRASASRGDADARHTASNTRRRLKQAIAMLRLDAIKISNRGLSYPMNCPIDWPDCRCSLPSV